MNALAKLFGALDGARSTSQLKLRVMDGVAAPFGAGSVGLYLLDDIGDPLEIHSSGVSDTFVLTYEQLGRGGDPILERALRTGTPIHDQMVFTEEQWKRSDLFRECGGRWRIQHYLCAPIVAAGRIVGTLNLGRPSEAHPFTVREMGQAHLVCQRLGARLRDLARPEDERTDGARLACEEVARRRAARGLLRRRAITQDAPGEPLDGEQIEDLWKALERHETAPVDIFDHGDRRYLVLVEDDAGPPPARPLSARQAEIARRAALGQSNKQIAFDLGISVATVGTCLLATMRKLGVRSRVTLVQTVRRLGLA